MKKYIPLAVISIPTTFLIFITIPAFQQTFGTILTFLDQFSRYLKLLVVILLGYLGVILFRYLLKKIIATLDNWSSTANFKKILYLMICELLSGYTLLLILDSCFAVVFIFLGLILNAGSS
jgi:hypothetical protein